MSQTPKARTIPQLREAAQADYAQHPPATQEALFDFIAKWMTTARTDVTLEKAHQKVYMGVDHPYSDEYE